MTSPLLSLLLLVPDAHSTHTYLATVSGVDTVNRTADVDDGSGLARQVLYVGTAPAVGQQVILHTFENRAVIVGGGSAGPPPPTETQWRARQRLAAPAALVTFTGIPSNLRALRLTYTARCSSAAALSQINLRVNNDQSGVYSYQITQDSNAAMTSGFGSAATYIHIGHLMGANAPNIIYASGTVDLLPWDNPGIPLNVGGRSWSGEASSANIITVGGVYASTGGPRTRIDLYVPGANFVTACDFQLFGEYS